MEPCPDESDDNASVVSTANDLLPQTMSTTDQFEEAFQTAQSERPPNSTIAVGTMVDMFVGGRVYTTTITSITTDANTGEQLFRGDWENKSFADVDMHLDELRIHVKPSNLTLPPIGVGRGSRNKRHGLIMEANLKLKEGSVIHTVDGKKRVVHVNDSIFNIILDKDGESFSYLKLDTPPKGGDYELPKLRKNVPKMRKRGSIAAKTRFIKAPRIDNRTKGEKTSDQKDGDGTAPETVHVEEPTAADESEGERQNGGPKILRHTINKPPFKARRRQEPGRIGLRDLHCDLVKIGKELQKLRKENAQRATPVTVEAAVNTHGTAGEPVGASTPICKCGNSSVSVPTSTPYSQVQPPPITPTHHVIEAPDNKRDRSIIIDDDTTTGLKSSTGFQGFLPDGPPQTFGYTSASSSNPNYWTKEGRGDGNYGLDSDSSWKSFTNMNPVKQDEPQCGLTFSDDGRLAIEDRHLGRFLGDHLPKADEQKERQTMKNMLSAADARKMKDPIEFNTNETALQLIQKSVSSYVSAETYVPPTEPSTKDDPTMPCEDVKSVPTSRVTDKFTAVANGGASTVTEKKKKNPLTTEYVVDVDFARANRHDYPTVSVQRLSGNVLRFRTSGDIDVQPALLADSIVGAENNSKAACKRATNVEIKGQITSTEKYKRWYHAKWLAFVDSFLHILAGAPYKHGRMFLFANGPIRTITGKVTTMEQAINMQPHALGTALYQGLTPLGPGPAKTCEFGAVTYVVRQLQHRIRQFRLSAKSKPEWILAQKKETIVLTNDADEEEEEDEES